MTKKTVNLSLGRILLCFSASAVVAFYLGRYTSKIKTIVAARPVGACNVGESISVSDARVYDTRIQEERQVEEHVSYDENQNQSHKEESTLKKNQKVCGTDEMSEICHDTGAIEDGDDMEDHHLFVHIKFEGDRTSLLPTSQSHLKDIMMKIMAQRHHSLCTSSSLKIPTHETCDESKETRGFSCVSTVLSDSESNSKLNSNMSLWTHPKDNTMTFSIFKKNTPRHQVIETLMLIQDELGLQTTDKQNEGDTENKPFIWWSVMRQKRHLPTSTHEKSNTSESPASQEYDEVYYESFVHPVMFSHYWAQRVAIIGADSSNNNFDATLREVIKHKTVSDVQIFMSQDSSLSIKENLYGSQDFYNCSSLHGTTTWCDRNDNLRNGGKRVKIKIQDTKSWIDTNEIDDSRSQELFDVVLVDTLNLSQETELDQKLWYTNEIFIKSLFDSLGDYGLAVFQLGMMPKIMNPHAPPKHWSKLISEIEKNDFDSIHIYSEAKVIKKQNHVDSSTPCVFLVAMKHHHSRKDWYDGTGALSVKIIHRIIRTRNGHPILKHFDGSTMKKYQVPHKIFQSIYCQSKSEFCQDSEFDLNRKDADLSDFEVKMSTVGEGSGRGLFSTIDIEKGTTIGLKTTIYPVYFNPGSFYFIEHYEIKDIFNYADGYGWQSSAMGVQSFYVEPNTLTFVNHGCFGSYNIDSINKHVYKDINSKKSGRTFTEQNVEISDFPTTSDTGRLYSPYYDRHIHHKELSGVVTVKDISAGDEIFSDYLFYSIGSVEEFYEEAQVLKRICSGDEVGLITMSERSAASSVS